MVCSPLKFLHPLHPLCSLLEYACLADLSGSSLRTDVLRLIVFCHVACSWRAGDGLLASSGCYGACGMLYSLALNKGFYAYHNISIPALHKYLLLPFCLPKGSAGAASTILFFILPFSMHA